MRPEAAMELLRLERVPFPLDDVSGRIALVGCGKNKEPFAAPASKLYTSTYFREVLTTCRMAYDHVYILSAKHGVVALDANLNPYDATLPWSLKTDADEELVRRFQRSCRLPLQGEEPWPWGLPIDIHAGQRYARWFPGLPVAVRWADWGPIGVRRNRYRLTREAAAKKETTTC